MSHRFAEWEPDLSSQTGASQAGILLGSNENIPAFRWVEKETATTMACSAPADCAELERRHATGVGLLTDGGASRGNLLSGEAEHVILTVSRMEAEKGANPGYRAFFSNGFNVTRVLVLFFWEVFLEWTAALRAIRRDVRPRGHRSGLYPFMRAAMCVVVRDLIVYGVLSDMLKGRPAIYATFSSYDEVAHHSGLERADTLEALRKLDQQFGRIDRARRYSPRPYEIVVLSDHGQTQGATFKQRNGYGLEDLVERSLASGEVTGFSGGDEQNAMVGLAVGEATGADTSKKRPKNDVSDRQVVVMGSGNLGLVYLMDERRRLTLEEIETRHPRSHPRAPRASARGLAARALAARTGRSRSVAAELATSPTTASRATIRSRAFSANAAHHLRRTDGFQDVADIMVGSFYDPQLDEGCAFEELISFHGGLGGPQTRPFILCPASLPSPRGAHRRRGIGPRRAARLAPAAAGRARDRRGARRLARGAARGRDLLAPRLRQLLDDDLDGRGQRHRGQRAEDAEQSAEERDGDDDEEAGEVDGLALDLRREDVVLELLVDEDDDEHDQRRGQALLRPQRRDEDEPRDRRADVRDHVEQPGDDAEPDGVARPEEPRGRSPASCRRSTR